MDIYKWIFLLLLQWIKYIKINSQFTSNRSLAAMGSSLCQTAICYKGGIKTDDNMCDRTTDDNQCPVCLTSTSGLIGCFNALATGSCPFGTNCTGVIGISTTTSPPTSSNLTPTPSNSSILNNNKNTNGTTNTNNTTNNNKTATNVTTNSTKSSNLPLILGLIGASIAVIAIVIGMFMLIRKGNDDDETNTNLNHQESSLNHSLGMYNSNSIHVSTSNDTNVQLYSSNNSINNNNSINSNQKQSSKLPRAYSLGNDKFLNDINSFHSNPIENNKNIIYSDTITSNNHKRNDIIHTNSTNNHIRNDNIEDDRSNRLSMDNSTISYDSNIPSIPIMDNIDRKSFEI